MLKHDKVKYKLGRKTSNNLEARTRGELSPVGLEDNFPLLYHLVTNLYQLTRQRSQRPQSTRIVGNTMESNTM